MKRRNPVALADEQVPITTACRLIGMYVPEAVDMGRSVKLRCPFGEIYHRDHGVEAAFRVYPESNHAWCFSCGQHYGPTRLVAQAWGISRLQAAAELLERAGIKPATLADLWAEVAHHEPAPDTTMLAEALKTFCRRVDPDWEFNQFEPPVAAALSACLGLLDHVRNQADAALWLDQTKRVMHTHLATVDDSQHPRLP